MAPRGRPRAGALPHLLSSPVRASARAENRLDETRTDALVPQPETGKISCVRRPCCGRLSPSACARQREICQKFHRFA
jgi:hypothetical protein